MVIQWGRQMANPDGSFGVIIQAIVDGKTVPVYVSAEAKDDFGIPACKDKAEDKIRSASVLPSPGDMLVKPPEVVPRSAPVPSSAPVSSAPVSSGPSSAAVPETEGTESGERLDPSNREEFLAGWESVGRSVAGMARRYGLSRQSIYRWMDAHGVPRTGGKVG
jgi:hypothetical protein